jgi:hypothetical protein
MAAAVDVLVPIPLFWVGMGDRPGDPITSACGSYKMCVTGVFQWQGSHRSDHTRGWPLCGLCWPTTLPVANAALAKEERHFPCQQGCKQHISKASLVFAVIHSGKTQAQLARELRGISGSGSGERGSFGSGSCQYRSPSSNGSPRARHGRK